MDLCRSRDPGDARTGLESTVLVWVACAALAGCASTPVAPRSPEQATAPSLCQIQGAVRVLNLGYTLSTAGGGIRYWGVEALDPPPPRAIARLLSTFLLEADPPTHLSTTVMELEYRPEAGLRVAGLAGGQLLRERLIPTRAFRCEADGLTYALPGDWDYGVATPTRRTTVLALRVRPDGTLDVSLQASSLAVVALIVPFTRHFAEELSFGPPPPTVGPQPGPQLFLVGSATCPDLSGVYYDTGLTLLGDGRGMNRGVASTSLAQDFLEETHSVGDQELPTPEPGPDTPRIRVEGPGASGLTLTRVGEPQPFRSVAGSTLDCQKSRWRVRAPDEGSQRAADAANVASIAIFSMGTIIPVFWEELYFSRGLDGGLLVEQLARMEGLFVGVIPLHTGESIWHRFELAGDEVGLPAGATPQRPD